MTAIFKDLPAGVAGDLTRESAAIIEYGALDGSVAFGSPVVFDTTKNAFRAVTATDTAVYGVLARVAPSTPESRDASVMVRGYIKAKVVGTPSRGGAVYIQTVADGTAGKAVGDFVTEATASKTIAYTGAVFAVNGADDNGITVIRVL